MQANTNETAAAVRAAAAHLRQTEAEADRITAALAQAEAEAANLPPPADLERLRAEVADLSAAVALGEAAPGDVEAARDRLATAERAEREQRAARERTAAVVTGLQRRHAQAMQARELSADSLAEAETAHHAAIFEKADREFAAAAAAMSAAWSRAAAARRLVDRTAAQPAAPEVFALGPASQALGIKVQPWSVERSGIGVSIVADAEAQARADIARELAELKAAPMETQRAGLVARAKKAFGVAA